MTHNVEAIYDYNFKPSDEFLLDTNIWLLVYAPQRPKDNRVAVYSQALSRIIAAQSLIYIDILVVSEFINAYARLKWQLWKLELGADLNFKQFRNSKDFKPVAQDISADVKRVLRLCRRVDDSFESLEIDSLIDEYAAGVFDFNDQILTTLCKRKGLKLVTDDSDFKGQGIPVVTANKRLLG